MNEPEWISKAKYDFLKMIGKAKQNKAGDFFIFNDSEEMQIPKEWGDRLRRHDKGLDN